MCSVSAPLKASNTGCVSEGSAHVSVERSDCACRSVPKKNIMGPYGTDHIPSAVGFRRYASFVHWGCTGGCAKDDAKADNHKKAQCLGHVLDRVW